MHYCRTFSFILLAGLLWFSPMSSGELPYWTTVLMIAVLALAGAWPLISRWLKPEKSLD